MKTPAWIACSFVLSLAAAAQQPPPDYGFDFVTIGDVGNAPWMGTDVSGQVTNPGSVSYEYRIARLETRTSQFLQFMNVLGQLVPQTAEFSQPASWGGVGIIQNDGTIRFELSNRPDAENFPVVGISWRLAAIYCNWLHNDKGQTLDDLNFGAYDTSTFIRDPNSPNLLDQSSRSPDARYWIPSLDEWLKAAHYDPNRNGPGPGLDSGGWWQFPNGTDEPLTPGLPGEPGAETSYRLDDPTIDERRIPVGSYPQTQSPWGLLDVSGGAPEWTETWLPGVLQTDRMWMGSLAGPELFSDLGVNQDVLWRFGAENPSLPLGSQGLRIASAVPSPPSALLVGTVIAVGGARRLRTAESPPGSARLLTPRWGQ